VPTGIVEGPDGAYYMSQLTGFPFPDGTLTEPGGIAVGDHGDLFVTNRSRSPDDGQVLRISADP
jgi:glucose/arabinose dehydrogenase